MNEVSYAHSTICSESGRIRLLHTTYVHFIVSFNSSRLKQRFPTVAGGDLYRR